MEAFLNDIDKELFKIKTIIYGKSIFKKLYLKFIYKRILNKKFKKEIEINKERREADQLLYGKLLDNCIDNILKLYIDIISRYGIDKFEDSITIHRYDEAMICTITINSNEIIKYTMYTKEYRLTKLEIYDNSGNYNLEVNNGFLDYIKRKAEFDTVVSLINDLLFKINSLITEC